MRPVPIQHIPEGMTRRVLAAPGGDLTDPDIAPAEFLVWEHPRYGRVYAARLELEDGDLDRLTAGEPIWLLMIGSVPPFDAHVDTEPHPG